MIEALISAIPFSKMVLSYVGPILVVLIILLLFARFFTEEMPWGWFIGMLAPSFIPYLGVVYMIAVIVIAIILIGPWNYDIKAWKKPVFKHK